MKKTVMAISLMAACAIQGCSGQGWTKEELSLIENGSPVMHVLSIDVVEENEILRRKSENIPLDEIGTPAYDSLAVKMVATVCDPSQNGVGIAGPQVGISRRIVAVQRFDKQGEPFEVYPNIRITEKRGKEEAGPEGCLSVPDKRGEVLRSRDITISYTSTATLKDTTENITGFTAVIFQHECDHLDGIVFTDRIADQ